MERWCPLMVIEMGRQVGNHLHQLGELRSVEKDIPVKV